MQVSFFVRLAVVALLLAAFANGDKQCGSGKEGKAVRGNKYMSIYYKMSDASDLGIDPSFDRAFCRDWCMMKSKCRAWVFKSNTKGGRCNLHKKGYKWVRYTGQSSTYAGRCWPN